MHNSGSFFYRTRPLRGQLHRGLPDRRIGVREAIHLEKIDGSMGNPWASPTTTMALSRAKNDEKWHVHAEKWHVHGEKAGK